MRESMNGYGLRRLADLFNVMNAFEYAEKNGAMSERFINTHTLPGWYNVMDYVDKQSGELNWRQLCEMTSKQSLETRKF